MATSFSPSSTSASAATSRTTRTSAAPEVTSGAAGPATTGRTPVPELAGGFGDELFGPVREAHDAGPVLGNDDLVPQRAGSAQGRAEGQPDVLRSVLVEDLGGFLGLIQERLDIHAGQARRDQPERGQGRVPAADVGVRVEHGPVAGLAGGLIQRGARDR